MVLDPSGKYAQQLRELMKLQSEDIVSTPSGPYSRSQQRFLPRNPDEIVEVDFGPYVGTKKVPYSHFEEWKRVHDSGDRNAELEYFYRRGWVQRPAQTASGEPGRPRTVEERETSREVERERAKQTIAQEAPRITRIETNAENAGGAIRAAASMKDLARSNPRAFDLMNDPGVATAVMRAAKAGIQAGNFGSISIPTDVLYQGVRLPPQDREALQLFAQQYANLTVQFRKAARVPGEGATTEREGDLYAALGALPTDTARVIRLKSEFVEEAAKHDQRVFRAWEQFNRTGTRSLREFLASDTYRNIADAYDQRLEDIRKNNADLLRTAPQPSSQRSQQPQGQQSQGRQPSAQSPSSRRWFQSDDGMIRRRPAE